MSNETAFDAGRYLTKLSGRDYLEVKWRLLWLRTEHPDAVIETELVRDDGASATFRARATLPTGATATGWGSEHYDDFADYLEKAETKALGRALAALGFGTQFAIDWDDGRTSGRVIPATGATQATQPAAPAHRRPASNGHRHPAPSSERPTNDAFTTFWRTASEHGWEKGRIEALCQTAFAVPTPAGLSPAQLSLLTTAIAEQATIGTITGGTVQLADGGQVTASLPTPTVPADASPDAIDPHHAPVQPATPDDTRPTQALIRQFNEALRAAQRQGAWTADEVQQVITDLWAKSSPRQLSAAQLVVLTNLVRGQVELACDPDGRWRTRPVPAGDAGQRPARSSQPTATT